MCLGNRPQPVFRDGRDNEMFLDALGEAAAVTDFQTVTNLIPTTDPQKFIKLNVDWSQ
jgi:hypothetical protein